MRRHCFAVLGLLIVLLPTLAWAQANGVYTALANSNIRAEPTIRSTIVGGLKLGETIKVTGQAADGNWYQVELPQGGTGYVYAKLLQPPATMSHQATPPAVTQQETAASGPPTHNGRSPSPPGAYVYFINLHDGETLPPSGQIWVQFGLRNMGVAPAGVDKEYTGHHHLLIDTDLPPLDKPIPSDDHHVHFGRGQTEYLLQLSPGKHTLQLLLGDKDHYPHDPPVMSKKITVYVPQN